MKRIKLSGTVFSGGGEGKKFLELPWVKRQITEKLGFVPYSGTLNVKLSEESAKRRKLLEKAPSVKICPADGYCNGLLFKALIGTLECAIVVPEVAGYPKNLLEIIASVNLRETLQLEDGSEVAVTVNL
ncbi:CTP-dependent riboflavin kinase [Candidatus Bathyarchaeota archaeon]|nr:CTP-dependent riboflavin kinase [Candidatus Bathyarchaeota archaeon]